MKRTPFLQKLETQLAARRARLLRTLAGGVSDLMSIPTGEVGDALDQAIDSEHAEICSQLAEVEARELAQIEQALDQIRHGGYGRCQTCAGPIAKARLQAVPYASDCIDCARTRDRASDNPAHRQDGRTHAALSGNDW